jgi:hypothetical protein
MTHNTGRQMPNERTSNTKSAGKPIHPEDRDFPIRFEQGFSEHTHLWT